ncbi:type III-B CRISPR module RAMP protein Cmr6 [Nocardiopsis coralliicola]
MAKGSGPQGAKAPEPQRIPGFTEAPGDRPQGADRTAPRHHPPEGSPGPHGPLGRRLRVLVRDGYTEERNKKQRFTLKVDRLAGERYIEGEPLLALQQRNDSEYRPLGDGANALTVLRRTGLSRFHHVDDGGPPKPVEGPFPVHRWAEATGLGQEPELAARALQRRDAFLRRWTRRKGNAIRRLDLVPEWRLVTGIGLKFGTLDTGITLHGTYGWPMLPGSSVKGLAAAGAALLGAPEDQVQRVLGAPRADRSGPPESESAAAEGAEPDGPSPQTAVQAAVGSVIFLDSLPSATGQPDGGQPAPTRRAVQVHRDVVTPHQKPYADDTDPRAPKNNPRSPAEHYAPVPLPFLSISGRLRVDLLGSSDGDLDAAYEWLSAAGDFIGAGGRVTAGYGYFSLEPAGKDTP